MIQKEISMERYKNDWPKEVYEIVEWLWTGVGEESMQNNDHEKADLINEIRIAIAKEYLPAYIGG